jgi:membrane protein
VEPPPDYSGLGRTADAQREIDRRVQSATAALIRQMLLLGAVTLGNVLTKRWLRRKKRDGRKTVR